jgi:hypothetical protein
MARLTAAKRHSLPPGDFAGSVEKESYPIDTRKRAKSALGLVGMHHPHSALQARVRAKVHRKYPDLGRIDGGRTLHRQDRARRKG